MTTPDSKSSSSKAMKLTVGPLKKFDDFQNWRYALKSTICADSGLDDIVAALPFVKDVEQKSVTFEALYSSREAIFYKLDMALFNSLLKALETSIDGALVTTFIRTKYSSVVGDKRCVLLINTTVTKLIA